MPGRSYQNVTHRSFSAGLNLVDAPNAVGEGEAIDLLNTVFSERGAVRQRDGFASFATLTNQPDSMSNYYVVAGTKRLVVGNGNRLDVVDTGGSSVANSTAPTANPHFFARFGGPSAEVIYIANGTDQVRKLAATTFSTPAGLSGQTGKFLTITPTSNRLVVARESGTTAGNNPSSVNFSDAGAPETFTASNYIDLDPGDGEEIQGICSWRDFVFIFKETKFWVHYGESVDSTGNPVFQVRKVDAGTGLIAPRALTVGPEGVYFMSRTGVWRTTGQEPELLSEPIEPLFGSQPTSIYFKSNTLSQGSLSTAAMKWHDHRIYLSVATGTSTTNDHTLVYDPRQKWWTLYDIAASCFARFRPSNQDELLFGAPTGTKYVHRHSASYTNDNGAAISSRWRSGWMDYQNPNQKTIRESELWGSGSLTLGVSKNFQDAMAQTSPVSFQGAVGADTWDPAGVDAWGSGAVTDYWEPSTAITQRLVRKGPRGSHFSTQFSNSTLDLTFTIHRLEQHLRGDRIPSAVEA